MKKDERFQIFGANRQEFRTSIIVAVAGFILVWVLFPPQAQPSHGFSLYSQMNAARCAFLVVVGFAALLCAINAYRDKIDAAQRRPFIALWCLVLVAWMWFSASNFLYWWHQVPPLTKPHWIQTIEEASRKSKNEQANQSKTSH